MARTGVSVSGPRAPFCIGQASRLPAPSRLTLALLLDSQKESVALLIKNHQIHNRFVRASLAQVLGKGFAVKKFRLFCSDLHFPAMYL